MTDNHTDTARSAERMSFYKLFHEKKVRIRIPIIQRDYAQGRKSSKEVRQTFLDALYGYLDENRPNRDLDFIYGSMRIEEGIAHFIPLDGQQRLTTLFLLHWYLYQLSADSAAKAAFKSALYADGKSMFTYETRSSSGEFCDALMDNDLDFERLLNADPGTKAASRGNALSKTIRNCAWFYRSWQYDPTIQSMLTMLDAIHDRFAGRAEFFGRLMDAVNPVITFLFLDLEDFRLTDDLYIKMNSRGKLLTPFENFKAKFEQYLDTIHTQKEFTMSVGSTEKKVSLREYFSCQIDTTWADLFWNYRLLSSRGKASPDQTFDNVLMNFIRVVIANQYAVVADVTSKERDDALEYLMGTQVARKDDEYSDVISFNTYKKFDVLNEKAVLALIDAFVALENQGKPIKRHIAECYRFYYDETRVFEQVLSHNLTNQERICFHAYLRFLVRHKGDAAGIDQWMRVTHNLAHPENRVIDSASEVAAAIRSIEELLPRSNCILEYLKQNPEIRFFSNGQVLEEKIKAHLITRNGFWKEAIESAEQHRYFNGQIGFLLEFAGILSYYRQHEHCHWTDEEDERFYTAFTNYAAKAGRLFAESYDNRINDVNFVFERAVLTKGDYLTEASQNRKNLLSTNLVKHNIKRDHSWKRVLRITDDGTSSEKHRFVKELFDDPRLDAANIVNSLTVLCTDQTDSWRDCLIECPDLIRYCNQGFIRFENENDIRLYKESQSNHTQAELFTYYLWKKKIEPHKDEFSPFDRIFYEEVRGIENFPGIHFSGFSHHANDYRMMVYYCPYYDGRYVYWTTFQKTEGDNRPDNFGAELKEALADCGFAWDDSDPGYHSTCDDSDSLLQKLHRLTSSLKRL